MGQWLALPLLNFVLWDGAPEWLVQWIVSFVLASFILIPLVGSTVVCRRLPRPTRRSQHSPLYQFSVLGIILPAIVSSGIGWWLYIRPHLCAPDDFDCLTVGSQWELGLIAVVALFVVAEFSAAVGALIGYRWWPVVGTR